MRQTKVMKYFCYQGVLQSVSGITKCDSYYNMRHNT